MHRSWRFTASVNAGISLTRAVGAEPLFNKKQNKKASSEMYLLSILAAAAIAGWLIDRFAFNGEFAKLVRDEARVVLARRRRTATAGSMRRGGRA
jgi:hypothetical protein